MDTLTDQEVNGLIEDYIKTVVGQAVPAFEKSLQKIANDARKSGLGATLVARNAAISALKSEIALLKQKVGQAPDIEQERKKQLELEGLRAMTQRSWHRDVGENPNLVELKEEIASFQAKFGTLYLE